MKIPALAGLAAARAVWSSMKTRRTKRAGRGGAGRSVVAANGAGVELRWTDLTMTLKKKKTKKRRKKLHVRWDDKETRPRFPGNTTARYGNCHHGIEYF